jgi:hypothetical protein
LQYHAQQKSSKKARCIIATDYSIFIEEIITEWNQYPDHKRPWGPEQDKINHQGSNTKMHPLHVFRVMGKPANPPKYDIPYRRVAFIPSVIHQFPEAIAAFSQIPAMQFITP